MASKSQLLKQLKGENRGVHVAIDRISRPEGLEDLLTASGIAAVDAVILHIERPPTRVAHPTTHYKLSDPFPALRAFNTHFTSDFLNLNAQDG